MEAYDLDLRRRILMSCDEGIMTRQEIADTFGVSRSFVQKLLRRDRLKQSIVPLPHGGGGRAVMEAAGREALRRLVEQQPDATLEQLRQRLHERSYPLLSRSTLCRVLERMDLPLKKRRSVPANSKSPPFNASGDYGESRWRNWIPESLFLWMKAGPTRA